MAVHLTAKTAAELHAIDGLQLYVGQAGIKYDDRNDITLIVLTPAATVGAVFTQNHFAAAPVEVCRNHLNTNANIRALVINTGIANAGTGEAGRLDALAVCTAVAEQIGCDVNQVLPFSTGVILEKLPADAVIKALPKVRPVYWDIAAEAIMTTDTVPKTASTTITINDTPIAITGMAKGSGMICPNMATMLGFIATDAAIAPELIQQFAQEIADESFNCITVDGDTSTNDSFVLIATGKTKQALIDDAESDAAKTLKAALISVAKSLATAIVRDGEGASKFITIQVNDAKSRAEARRIGYAIAHSPLVKTAFSASDANLGRILCAIGNAGIEDFDTHKVQVFLDNVLVIENGGRADLYEDEDGMRIMAKEEITVRVQLQRGEAKGVIYTCDLSHEYIRINAEYRS